MDIVTTTYQGDILKLLILYDVVYHQLRVHDIKDKLQFNQPAQLRPPANLVFVLKKYRTFG